MKTGEIIGEIRDNKWLLKKSGIGDYYNNDKSIEIIDKYGFVAFQLWVDEKYTVNIRGYFVGTLCTYFCNTDIFERVQQNDKDYISKCINLAQKLNRIKKD